MLSTNPMLEDDFFSQSIVLQLEDDRTELLKTEFSASEFEDAPISAFELVLSLLQAKRKNTTIVYKIGFVLNFTKHLRKLYDGYRKNTF